MRFGAVSIFATLLAAVPLAALAQDKPACAALDASLPPDLAAWTTRTDLAAAVNLAGLPKAELGVGRAWTAALRPTPEVAYPTRPEKPGGSVSKGGLFQLTVAAPGTYRIALSSGPWIDVLRDGKPVVSSAHQRGPECSTVRKMVDFPLTPGRYVIQVSASGEAALGVLVARLP